MTRRIFKWVLRLVLVLALIVASLLLPVGYVELACKGTPQDNTYAAVLPQENHRPESRTLLTYPEWHIVHAYDDYARVIKTGDPHEFGFARGISGFWFSLCTLSERSAHHGGFPWETKQMVYTIGISFTAEMLAKAAYEETFGRLSAALRGDKRAELDDVSARQAADYAGFLQQVPWYKWNFRRDASELTDDNTGGLRNIERRLALGLEYRVKAAYAGVIEQAVAQVGADELTLRMVVTGASPADLSALEGVTVIAERAEGIEIETPRYRTLTHLMQAMAVNDIDFVEIAGNDDILLTATSPDPETQTALFSFERQGYGDWRHLIILKVQDLGAFLRAVDESGLTIEHIHDY